MTADRLVEPRYTAVWKNQLPHLVNAWREVSDSAEIRPYLGRLMEIRAARHPLAIQWDASIEPAIAWLRSRDDEIVLGELLVAVATYAPTFAFAYGPYTVLMLIRLADYYAGLSDLVIDRQFHFLPDNPLELLPDGTTARRTDQATGRDFLQLEQYHKSFRPAGKAGAPRKASRPTPTTPKPDTRRDRDARLACQLQRDGKTWHEIAAALGMTFGRYDRKASDRTRIYVDRLIEYGKIRHF